MSRRDTRLVRVRIHTVPFSTLDDSELADSVEVNLIPFTQIGNQQVQKVSHQFGGRSLPIVVSVNELVDKIILVDQQIYDPLLS